MSDSGLKKIEQAKPRPWRRWLKRAGIALGAVVALVLIAITVAVWILTPQRLTPLIEKYGSDYVNGSVALSRAELTFWSSFPALRVDVDSLDVVSHSLRSLPPEVRATLPADADSLLRVEHFDASINLLRLLTGEIALYDVNLVRPRVNLVQATTDAANYLILPPSEESSDTTATTLPDISLGSFILTGDAPIRYVSVPDSIDATVLISGTRVAGGEKPAYRLDFNATGNVKYTHIAINNLRLGLGGRIVFDPRTPHNLAVRGLKAGIGDLIAEVDAEVDLAGDYPRLPQLKVNIPEVKVTELLAMVPKELREDMPQFTSDMTMQARAELTRPFVIGDPHADSIPSLRGELKIKADRFTLDRLDLHDLALEAKADIDGRNLDRSVITLERLHAAGKAIDITVKGEATAIVSDPAVKASLEGHLDLDRLPSALLARLPATVHGRLKADAAVDTRLSWLTPDEFHRVKLTGDMELTGLRVRMRDGSADLFMRRAEFRLGSSNSFVRDSHRVDSLLTASLSIDTVAFSGGGYHLGASALKAGVGCANRSSSTDRTAINPIGASFKIGLLNFNSDADTMRVKMREVSARASLSRWQGGKRAPLLALDIDAGKLRLADRFNRASLTDGSVALRLHPRATAMSPRMAAAVDSLRRLHPRLSTDSLRRMAQRTLASRRTRATSATVDSLDRRENLDMTLDGTARDLLRKWEATGSLRASKARLMTPYFPLRMSLTDLDMAFTTDSVAINSARLKAGNSDFALTGSISNINRALTSRRGSPLKIDLHLDSRTIDVNQLAEAAFAGSAFAEKADTMAAPEIDDSDNDDAVAASVALNADATGALLVPSNVDADFTIHAANVAYSDVLLHNLTGMMRVHDGALNLDRLSATSDIGSVSFSALYSAPTRRELNFAFGMNLRNFHISKFLQMMPAVDSIMPLLRDISGIINAEVAATTELDPDMNIKLPTLSAALKLSGDSLVLMDAETFRTIGKWLMFKQKEKNMVDHLSVELTVHDSRLDLYPFMFDIDRYRLGVLGGNDLAMNYKYHVSVLKSPIPFKFGINISGNADKMKVRLGGAKFKDNMAVHSTAIADTTRINLLRNIEQAFRRGVKSGNRVNPLRFHAAGGMNFDEAGDTISHADSLVFIQNGVIPAPPAPVVAAPAATPEKKKKGKKK